MTDGVDAIYGIKADGKSEVQSLRFDKTKFTETQAKQWLKKNNFKSILFEPSSGEERKMAMSPEDLNDMQVSPTIPPRDREMYAMKDVYTTAEKAEARAKEMGGEGSHEHEHMVDDKKITLYMPFPSHDEYLKAVEEMEEETTDDMGMKKEEEVKDKVTAGDVHIEKPFTQLECDCDEGKAKCDCEKTETSANEYSLEQTFNINGIEIFSEGEWNGDIYKRDDLEKMVSSFGKTGFEPPVKIGHNEEQPELKDGAPALGYIDKIYIEGKKLLADFKELPKKVYEAMKRGNYKRVSSEIYWNYAKDGKVFDRVLKAVALLGAEVPAVTNLESITGLYSKDNSELKIYDKGVDIVDNEQKDYSIEVAQLKEELDKVNQEKDDAIQQLKEKDDVIKSESINSYMKELKAEGKVLPVFEKELVALMSHSSDEKVFKYSEDDTEIELSQFELCKKIFSSIPSLIEFSELSEAADIPEDYSNAGVEADRRAKLYMENGKADNYRDALYAVLAKDEELKEKYEKEGK